MEKIRKLFLYLFLVLSFDAIAQDRKEKSWYDNVNFSGFVDVYFNYLSNNRQGGTQDTSGTFNTYNKQFAINAVELDVEKIADKSSPWGFRLDLQNGQNLMYQERPYQTTNSLHNMNMLQQAYVSFYFPVAKGLTVDVGKMATHIGFEVLESKDNINYTIGYIFFNTIPFIHTGARATLTLSENWSAGLYLYNSAQGTGFTGNGQQFGYQATCPYGAPADPALCPLNGQSSLTSISQHAYVDGPNPTRAIGTQVKGVLIKDKLQLTWNTLTGNDNVTGRMNNSEYYSNQYASTNYGFSSNPIPSKFKTDHWHINNAIFTFTPNDRSTYHLDLTYGERNGQTNTAAFGYERAGVNGDRLSPYNYAAPENLTTALGTGTNLTRENNVKRIYETYGLYAKYEITEKFGLGVRYENINDKRYGGPLVVNAPLFAYTPADRYDLAVQESLGLRAAGNLGQIRTLTLTPTYNWTENLIIKLDLRRDWGLGMQFVDTAGRPSHSQMGFILGMVAKF